MHDYTVPVYKHDSDLNLTPPPDPLGEVKGHILQ